MNHKTGKEPRLFPGFLSSFIGQDSLWKKAQKQNTIPCYFHLKMI